MAKKRKNLSGADEGQLSRMCKEEFDSLSRLLDRSAVQDSAAVRNVLRSRLLANTLIDEKGDLNFSRLNRAINYLNQSLFSLGPNRQFDAKRQKHLLKVLTSLNGNKELQRLLRNIGKPYANRYAEQLIKETLQSPPNEVVNDPQARRAAFTAWLSLLRQNVGSCFATAPAILVCQEQPELFFKDLAELFGTGRIKRTFGGREYSVPLSASWGAGDLRRLVSVERGPLAEQTELWYSPGILAGLEAGGVIGSELALQSKIERTKELFLEIVQEWPTETSHLLISPELFLRKAILKSLKLTETDIKEYENRPQVMRTGGLMMQATTGQQGGKAQICRQFAMQFETASTAFKMLAENALLKSWEFSLASFSETKLQFASWNLYASLGLGPQEEGGIGFSLYTVLKKKLDYANQQFQETQFDYDQAYGMIRYLETRLRTAGSEKEAEWIKLEYRTRRYEFERIEETRNKWQFQAQRYANLFDPLVDLYMSLFPLYFQEVYDADMHEISPGPYDDSPAGFRLIYKHGRSNTAQWTRIQTPSEFVEALASFFISTEIDVAGSPDMEGLQDDVSEITTAIVVQIRTPEFLETAFHRMARAHKTAPIRDPLENLDKIDKKPWAYTSGGTMDTLVSCYWKREQKPTEVGRWVENPTELLVFLADTMKQIPPKISEDYIKNPEKLLLMHSPTHAFLFTPGKSPFRECWMNEDFTYTAVRDKIIKPVEKFIDLIVLDQAKVHFLIAKLAEKVPPNFQPYFRQTFSYVYGGMNPSEFRDYVVTTMSKERGLAFGRRDVLAAEEIDSLLFELLPLFPQNELKMRVLSIFECLPGIDKTVLKGLEELWQALPISMSPDPLISAKTLQDIVKAFLCLLLGQTSTSHDYHLHVSLATKKLGFAMPMPLIFADSNWARDEFGFVVNPGTGKCELWRVDYTGSCGAPMSSWDQWLDGSRKDRTWAIYTAPHEYKV